jgi:luciferase family oxidoreductase group 1
MQLSVLEQSTLSEGSTGSAAINNTVHLATELDAMGFHRLWLSEHHNMSILQGSAPEVLLASVGARTKRIRIGSGGVMLPNHSAYHIAEAFRVLEALYPGRVDCGIGQASGGDAYSRSLLASVRESQEFPSQLDLLDRFFHDQCQRAQAMPAVEKAPPLWLLSAGSHPESGYLAAEKGLGLALALFINPHTSVEAVRQYRQRFIPSPEFPKPRVLIALNFVCAATPEKLSELKKTSDFFRLMRDSGRYPSVVPTPERLSALKFGANETAYLNEIANREVTGLPHEAKDKIVERAGIYQADEVMLTCMTWSLQDKLDGFRLIAEAFGVLKQRETM